MKQFVFSLELGRAFIKPPRLGIWPNLRLLDFVISRGFKIATNVPCKQAKRKFLFNTCGVPSCRNGDFWFRLSTKSALLPLRAL